MSLPRTFVYFYLICMTVAAAQLSVTTEIITALPEFTTTNSPDTYSPTLVDVDVSTTDGSATTVDDSSHIFVTDDDLLRTTSIPKNEETTTEEVTTVSVPEQTTKVTTTERPKNDISITCLPDCGTPDDKMDIEKLTEILQSISKETEKDWRVVDVGVTNWSDSTLSVSWKPPNDTANIVQAYVVKWFTQNGKDLVGACRASNETQNITIFGLNTCKIYEIHVIPATSERLGEQKVAVESTGLIVGNDTLNLQVAENGTHWLKIKWTVVSHDCITKTLVTYCDGSQCKNEAVNTTSFNATDLLPCTEYNFTVAFSTNGRELGQASVTAATEFFPPGKPSPAWTLAGDKNLMIFWTPPEGYTCVQYYSVSLSLGITITNTTSDTQITFEGLRSCSIYNVTITPMPQLYMNSTEMISSNKTFAPVPISPLLEGKPFLTSQKAIFSWRLPLDNLNNCEDTNIFTQCNFTHVLGQGYSGSNSSKSVNITAGSVVHVTNVAIDNLSPFTQYNCHSVASNSRGMSSISKMVVIRTLEDVPSQPFLDVYNITDKIFTLVWKKPKYIPGNITSFEISFSWFFKFHQPEACKKMHYNTEEIVITDGSTFLRTVIDGVPYSQYTAKVKAMTAAGWGNSSEDKSFFTAAGAPGPVSNLTFVINENPFDKNILDASLAWGMPCLINAERIDYFNITWLGHRLNYPSHFLSERMYNEDGTCPGDNCTRKVVLREEYTYTFWVYGKAKDYAGLGNGTSTTATFPAGIPPLPDENYIQQITIDPYKSRRTTTSATILLPIFPNTYGDIRCYAIMVAAAGYNNGSFSRISLSAGQWPEAASWRESMLLDFKIPYQAAKFCDNRCFVDYGKLEAVKFVIGEDSETCPELSEKHKKSYCNGPLKPDTWYDVRIRAFTNGGYRDSTIFKVKTNAELRVAIVVGTIFGILFLGILTTIMLLIRKCSLQAFLRRFLHSDMPGSPVPAPFNRRKFIAHCQQLADNPGKLSNEFQLLQTLSVDLQMPTNAACLQANRKKNRYTDILPYDFSRVKLDPIDNDPNSDYINASFIKGFCGEEEYIACQGPKEETTQDFWRMIDQYDVKLIVMLTQLVEKNKEKCHQYYPTIRETFNYENMCIRCTSELDYRTYTQRTLTLQKENEKRTIIHLHFKDWPDHDVPEDFDAMVNFCQMMRRHVVANRGLAVVHCSAGIGRTGTLIAIDILLQHIKENRKLDVFGTVYRLRHHRINMVQRESQYAYIYNCIRQVLKNPYFSKSYKPPSVDPVTDNANNNKMGNSMTNLVSSMETLKKSSLLSSSSVQSADALCDNLSLSLSSSSSTSSTDKSTCGPLLHGLRNSKSTSAIYCNKPARCEFVRYSTQDFSKLNENTCTIQLLEDQTGDHNSNKSIYDNFDSTKNSKCHSNDEEDDDDDDDNDTAAQKLLDTSV